MKNELVSSTSLAMNLFLVKRLLCSWRVVCELHRVVRIVGYIFQSIPVLSF